MLESQRHLLSSPQPQPVQDHRQTLPLFSQFFESAAACQARDSKRSAAGCEEEPTRLSSVERLMLICLLVLWRSTCTCTPR